MKRRGSSEVLDAAEKNVDGAGKHVIAFHAPFVDLHELPLHCVEEGVHVALGHSVEVAEDHHVGVDLGRRHVGLRGLAEQLRSGWLRPVVVVPLDEHRLELLVGVAVTDEALEVR